jgi:hypothetical protein
MAVALPSFRGGAARIVVVGDGGSPLASELRGCGHQVNELLPSDFHGQQPVMVDVVAVLPDCRDAARVGAVAAACAQCVWFQEHHAPPGLAEVLEAAGIPVVEDRDLAAECCA